MSQSGAGLNPQPFNVVQSSGLYRYVILGALGGVFIIASLLFTRARYLHWRYPPPPRPPRNPLPAAVATKPVFHDAYLAERAKHEDCGWYELLPLSLSRVGGTPSQPVKRHSGSAETPQPYLSTVTFLIVMPSSVSIPRPPQHEEEELAVPYVEIGTTNIPVFGGEEGVDDDDSPSGYPPQQQIPDADSHV
ncbi:hypothetical protein C8J57DRAFT_1321948 [Mycena rebaudengoi]|nr:hypothetical protein C8J57DRAFT_1321948 [Mycena rebaudengoi]